MRKRKNQDREIDETELETEREERQTLERSVGKVKKQIL